MGLKAQNAATESAVWRHIGNSAIDLSLAGLATGPVERVWYGANGSLLIRTVSGQVFETADFETWKPSAAAVPAAPSSRGIPSANLLESDATIRAGQQVAYAFGKFVYRSENNGVSWDNLTEFRSASIVGGPLNDLAVSPANDDEVVVAGADGVFRSMDGGKTWCGLNQTLPNLPALRLLSLPAGDRGASLALADGSAVEWAPGQKVAWTPVDSAVLASQLEQRRMYSAQRSMPVTALAASGNYIYTGMIEGRLSASSDGGVTWTTSGLNETGSIEQIWVDPNDSRIALAVAGAHPRDLIASTPPHVLRTQNGGLFWDDLTGNLPDVAAHGVVADRASGAVYVATDAGVFMTYTDLETLGAAPKWTLLEGLPQARAMDVSLDPQGNQLWVALDGAGVYATLAPHRLRDPRVVSTADLVARATAPGSLVSVLGAKVQTAEAGGLQVPVLTAGDSESQLQIPFEAQGSTLSLAVDSAAGSVTLPPVPLGDAAPAIFVDRDGSPILLDGDSGVMLDAMNPAHSGSRIEILATGLGRVKPDWPTGIPGPVENPPQVVGTVRAYLDREPVEVTRAVLAPYIGFYMVDVQVPKIVNSGPAELYLEVEGQPSNRVRVYIQP